MSYVEAFHSQRPGITEEVLSRALHEGRNPGPAGVNGEHDRSVTERY